MIKQIQEINFPNYATLSQATITLNDMGDKTISTQVKIDGSIIPDFSYDWEVEFKGERYIHPLRQPQAGKSNDSISSKIDLVFQHKTIYELKRYYFVEMTSTMSGTAIADQYIASLGLNLNDFCVAFQRVLDHYFNGAITIDLNPNIEYTKGVQFMSISYSYIWDVLQKVYEVYGVRWAIEGNTIKVGYPSTIVSHTFQYGYEGGLLQVERQVQDANIRNSLLGRGGEQNLPAYYFKEAPEGSLFASDPDAIPELANVYFSNLRGKTFRDYVKGWKAKHYGGTPMSEPTDAYTKGYTDTKFNPIEYVEDKESIEKYGLLQGGLDNNEEIYPSIQGAPNGEDVVVYVEPVTSDDVESSVSKVDAITLNGMSQYRSIPRELNGGKVNVTLQSEVFEVKEDNYALVIGNNVSYSIYRGFSTTPAWEGNPLVNIEEVVVNKDTNEVANKDSLLKGKYYVVTTFDITLPIYDEWPTIGSAENISFNAQLGISTNLQLRKSQGGATDKWLPTFDIWVKNIWHSTRNVGENDLEYAERVWRPILGDRQGNEAKVVFSSGWLSGHEDYEFTIVDFAYDNSHEDSEWRLTLAKSDAELEATGKYIPSASTNGQAYAGDTFFFIGIDMPHQYVLWGEERVDNWKSGELDKTSEIQPKWVVRLDKLRLNEENDNLVEQIKEGNAINLADVRFIDAPALQLYLQSVTYTWSEQTLLYPDIEVVLSDTIVPVQNPVAQIQGSIDTINSQLANIGNVAQVVRKIGDSLYLRKDGVADTSKSPTKFVGEVSGNNFRQGKVGGADWGIYRDENGNAIAEFDKIIARKDLEVNNLVISQVSYVGGMQITSAASIEITRVIENDNAYQCFFDQKGGSIANLFVVGDIAYSQRFDERNNTTKYYKRVVTSVDVDSITLSKSQADGNGVPMDGDVVIQYGNTSNSDRQYVIIRDVIGGGYERMLSDLNSVSSSGVEYYFAGRMDGNTPRWFVGNKSQQFIEYKDGHLQIKADVTIGANSDLSASEEFKKLQDDIKGLQNQIDGKVEAFFYNYDPKLDNLPASEWTTDAIKEEHLNDTFTNIESGQSWRWLLKDGVYQWVTISDTQALQMAQDALNLANSKVTIFTETPIPPYKVKDLWFQGEGGNTMRCVKARNEQESFNESDWVKADDYKDFASSVAGDAEQKAKDYADSQISSYDLTIKYLKDAFNKGSVLDVNGVTLSALVGVKDENGNVKAGLYGGGSNTLNNAGYADSTHGAMLLFGGIKGVDKPKTYKTAIFEDGFLQSTYFATAKEGKRVEISGNELKVYGDDANNSVLSISYDSTGKPRLQYTDKSGNVAWYLSDSGISTSYTVKQVDDLLAKYILKDTAQTISARHNFSDGLQIGGITIRKSQDGVVYVDGNLVIKGALTMFGTDATIPSSIWASIPFDSTMKWDGTKWSVAGGGSGSVDAAAVNVLISEYLAKNSYATQSWVQNQGYLTQHQSLSHLLSKTDAANTYQPIINSSNKLAYSLISGTPDLSVYFRSSDFTKSNIKSTLGISDWALAATKPSYTAAEVGALSTSGGTVSGTEEAVLKINTSYAVGVAVNFSVGNKSRAWVGYNTSDGAYLGDSDWGYTLRIGTDGKPYYRSYELIHANNIGSYNAGSATKLATPRTIWGQSFDGTGNVSGLLTDVAGIRGSTIDGGYIGDRNKGIGATDGGSMIYNYSASPITFHINGSERMRITDGGNVAIGDTTADYKLHVYGIGAFKDGVWAQGICLQNTDEINSYGSLGGNGNGSLYLNFRSSGLVSLAYGGGNVAIGGTTADARLHVHGSSRLDGAIYVSAGDFIADRATLILNSNNKPADIIFDSGNTTTGHYGHWTISSRSGEDGRFAIFRGGKNAYNASEAELFTISASGQFTIKGDLLTTGAITMFSQLSMKNVIDYDGLSLAQLAQIKPARFTWKDRRDNHTHVGGIADYIQPILPEVVYETANKELTVDYGSAAFYIGTSLIKPVIDHEQRLQSAEKEIKDLEAENKRLREQLRAS